MNNILEFKGFKAKIEFSAVAETAPAAGKGINEWG